MKLLFVYDHAYPEKWKDGLWAAIELLSKEIEVDKYNLQFDKSPSTKGYDFILGWGGFNSPVDKYIRSLGGNTKFGLCLAGYGFPPTNIGFYDVVFYECDWALQWLYKYSPLLKNSKVKLIKAFGVNTNIYHPIEDPLKIWDWISVGSFSNWKRHHRILNKEGYRLVIGEIQKGNVEESMTIISLLLANGVAVSDMVDPETLAKIYNSSRRVGIFCEEVGGGERSVLESRACGIKVEVSPDNEKLKEILNWNINGKIPDQYYYVSQIKKGIEALLVL